MPPRTSEGLSGGPRLVTQEEQDHRFVGGTEARRNEGSIAPLAVSSRRLLAHSYRVIRRLRYGTDSTWERHNDGGGPSSDTAESRETERACQALRRQPEDGRQVESADLRFRSADRTQGAQIDGPVSRGRGCRRRLPKAYAVAARRLPLRLAADHPASDALVPSSVSATPWDLPVAAGRRRSLRQTQIQGLSDRLFPYRHRRGSIRARQALP